MHQTDDSRSSNSGIAVFASFAAGTSPKTTQVIYSRALVTWQAGSALSLE
jgi:hypothetical protein